MSEKKKKKKQTVKKRKKSAKGSLLTRIFGKKKAGEDDKVKKKAKARIKPLAPIERSIAEIKQMKKIGERDPERALPADFCCCCCCSSSSSCTIAGTDAPPRGDIDMRRPGRSVSRGPRPQWHRGGGGGGGGGGRGRW